MIFFSATSALSLPLVASASRVASFHEMSSILLLLVVFLQENESRSKSGDLSLGVPRFLLHLLQLDRLVEKVFCAHIKSTLHSLHLFLHIPQLLLILLRLSLVGRLDVFKVCDSCFCSRSLVGELLHLLLDSVHSSLVEVNQAIK